MFCMGKGKRTDSSTWLVYGAFGNLNSNNWQNTQKTNIIKVVILALCKVIDKLYLFNFPKV